MNVWPVADPAPCAICGSSVSGVDPAHEPTLRSQGGTETMPLCRTHHRLYDSHEIDILRSPDILRVWKRASGEVLLERHYNAGFNQGQHIAELQAMPNLLEYCIEEVKYLDYEGMEEAASIVGRELGEKGWKYLAELMRRARLMIPWGDRTEKLTTIANKCGISWRTVQRLALIAERIDLPTLAASRVDDMSMVLVAAEAVDPVAALAHIEERKAENPSYSTRQARSEITTQEAVAGGKGLERAITLLHTMNAMSKDVDALVGALEPSPQADQIAALAHEIYERLYVIGGRASPGKEEGK